MANNGYIKLYRKMTEWGWYKDANTMRVFMHLLFTANFKESEYMGVKIYPGQTVVGRKALAETLGISEQSVRTSINHLKSTNEITIKSTNKFSVITVVNWAKYQCDDGEDNQQINQQANQQLTNNQPATNHTIRKKERKNIGGNPKKSRDKAKELDDFYAMTEAWANDET